MSHLTSMLDGVGTTVYTYDSVGRMLSENLSPPNHWRAETHRQRLRQAGGPWPNDTVTHAYGNNTAGLRSSLSLTQPNASAWAQSYTYDGAKRLKTLTSPAGAFTYDYGAPASSPAFLVSKLTLPSGAYVTNTFDSVARLTGTYLRNSGGTVLNSHAYVYNAGNQRTKQTRTDGSYADYTYDPIGQLQSAFGKESGGVTNRLNEQFGYAYDAAGNLRFRTNNALIQTFTVDSLNELTNITRSGTLTVAGTTTSAATNMTVNGQGADLYTDRTFAKSGFTLANGNNTFTAIGQDTLGRKDTNAVTVNLPSSPTLTYDANGNLLYDGRRAFAYDDENQLIQVTMTNTWQVKFAYDGKLRRRLRTELGWQSSAWVTNAVVRYIYEGMLVIQERDGNNVPLVAYTRGRDLSGSLQGAGGIGGLLALTQPSAFSLQHFYYHADGNGNVTALINGLQLLVAKYVYDPYGNLLVKAGSLADANLYRFSSKEVHPLSGLYYYGSRFYDPNLQRWINRDPLPDLGFIVRQSYPLRIFSMLLAEAPQGPNLYTFVGNNPQNAIDPSGEFGIIIKVGRWTLAAGYAAIGVWEWFQFWDCVDAQTAMNKRAREHMDPLQSACWLKRNGTADHCWPLLGDALQNGIKVVHPRSLYLVLLR